MSSIKEIDIELIQPYKEPKTEKFSLKVSAKELQRVNNVKSLLRLLCYHSKNKISENGAYFIYRRSKKHKTMVPIEIAKDFQSMAASLKVKDSLHLKLESFATPPNYEQDLASLESGTLLFKQLFKEAAKLYNCNSELEFEPERSNESTPLPPNANNKLDEKNCSTSNESPVIHPSCLCDKCNNGRPISGARYKCLVCADFDLCESCIKKGVAVNDHRSNHPMIRFSHPDSFSLYKKITTGLPTMYSNDIVNNTPMKYCSEENRQLLKDCLRSKGYEKFLADIDSIIRKANSYDSLMDRVTGETEDAKHNTLLSLIEKFEKTKSENIDATDCLGEHISVEITKIDKYYFQLKLTNHTKNAIEGQNLKIELANEKESKSIGVQSPHDIHPKRSRLYNFQFDKAHSLGNFNKVFMKLSNSSGDVFGGKFSESKCILKRVDIDDKDVEEDEEIEKPIHVQLKIKSRSMAQIAITNYSNQPISCTNLKFQILNCFLQPICTSNIHNHHPILPSRTAKFNITVSNAHLKYPFTLTIDNEELHGSVNLNLKNLNGFFEISNQITKNGSLNVVDFLDEVEDSSNVELSNSKTSSIEKTGNPDNSYRTTEVEASSSENTDIETLEDFKCQTSSSTETELTTAKSKSSSKEISVSQFNSSMIIPVLNKNSPMNSSVYLDANSSILESKSNDETKGKNKKAEEQSDTEDNEDYDVISTDVGEDFGSDYDILSTVPSREQ